MAGAKFGVMVGLSLLAAGCGGGGGGGGDEDPAAPVPSAACSYINGGGTTTMLTTGCASCTVVDAAKAIDGDLDTYAQITWPAASGSGAMALRAIAQDGVIYPAGSMAGALISTHSGQVVAESAPDARTYQGDAPASADCCATTNVVGGGGYTNRQYQRITVQSQTDFDAVEVSYARGGSDAEGVLRVYEFCSDE
jgi:hypothetical protein